MLGSVSMLFLLRFGNVWELLCFVLVCESYWQSTPFQNLDLVPPDYIFWVSSVPLRFFYYSNFRGLTLSISSRFEKITSRPFGPMCLSLFLDQYFSQVFSTLQISIRFHFLPFFDLSEGKVVKTSLFLLNCKRLNSVICIFLSNVCF